MMEIGALKQKGMWLFRIVLFAVFLWLTVYAFDWERVRRQGAHLIQHPGLLGGMALAYFIAFVLRAWSWQRYLQKRVSFAECLHGLFYSLFLNHVLPVKAGDAVRIGYIIKQHAVTWDEAVHSVVVLRLLDMLILGSMAAAGILWLGLHLSMLFFGGIVLAGVLLAGGGYIWLRSRKQAFWEKHTRMLQSGLLGRSGLAIILATTASWSLEAWVVLGVLRSLGLDVPALLAIWANSMTIAGQVFHFTPGGIGTYESVMSFSLVTIGVTWKDAYTIAVLSHGFKFLFSYVAGAYAWLRTPLSWREMRGFMNPGK
jgi:uncharacterized membrane protein YbhN (UPF0104 family)